MLQLSREFFSPNEHMALLSVAEVERLTGFFRCWTRKESFIKALGLGLTFPLDGFEVSLTPAGPQLLQRCTAAPAEMTRWRIVAIPIDVGYTAALTTASRCSTCGHLEGTGFSRIPSLAVRPHPTHVETVRRQVIGELDLAAFN